MGGGKEREREKRQRGQGQDRPGLVVAEMSRASEEGVERWMDGE